MLILRTGIELIYLADSSSKSAKNGNSNSNSNITTTTTSNNLGWILA